jgi:hypothetical protein
MYDQEYPPQLEKKSNAIKWVIGIAVGSLLLCGGGLVACTAAAGAGVAAIEQEAQDKKQDVTVISCDITYDFVHTATLKLRAVNDSDHLRSYYIEYNVMDGKTKVGNGFAVSGEVQPGQEALFDGFATYTNAQNPTCEITDIT